MARQLLHGLIDLGLRAAGCGSGSNRSLGPQPLERRGGGAKLSIGMMVGWCREHFARAPSRFGHGRDESGTGPPRLPSFQEDCFSCLRFLPPRPGHPSNLPTSPSQRPCIAHSVCQNLQRELGQQPAHENHAPMRGWGCGEGGVGHRLSGHCDGSLLFGFCVLQSESLMYGNRQLRNRNPTD